MRESGIWYGLKIFAAIVTAVATLAAIISGSTVAVAPGLWALAALSIMIYADWRQRLDAAQEEWDTYMAELRQSDMMEVDAAQSVEDARQRLYRDYMVGGCNGCN